MWDNDCVKWDEILKCIVHKNLELIEIWAAHGDLKIVSVLVINETKKFGESA
jgi:hypothetical protein